MNVTRNGKIARLPKTVREEFNRRLENGEPAGPLVAWLNGLPEVLAVLAAEFKAQPIRPQNVSEWRKGGYRDWLAQQEALALAQQLGEDAVELKADGRAPLTDALALWLAARYAVATRQVRDTEGTEGWRLLRELCADIVELRRGDHSAERLRIEREQLDLEREREREKNEADFLEWALQGENRDKICEGYLCREERMRRIRAILHPELEDESEAAEALAKLAGAAGNGSQRVSEPNPLQRVESE